MKVSKLVVSLLVITGILYACSSDSDIIANTAPAAFTVSNGTLTETTATITWTAATDSDGDIVSYAVNLDGTEVTNSLSVLTYSFSGLTAGTAYTGTIVATDGNGGSTSTSFSFTASGTIACNSGQVIDTSRGNCNETLTITNSYNQVISGTNRVITSNSVPAHMVGLFGSASGSLNPNAITTQNETYTITTSPVEAASVTALLATGPQYSFGVLLNGVELDPVAAEPFPHEGAMSANANWNWNLEALNVNLGLDCNNAHVQPTGKYHYHGSPTLFLEGLNVSTTAMTLIGYAADGFPIYYKYAYTDATDNTSAVIEMSSSYQLQSGDRGGDGVTAPCGTYDGVYTQDYEYVTGLGTLDDANGRTGVTPEFPGGTYYYVVTDAFPSIPRYFKGTPSNDFSI